MKCRGDYFGCNVSPYSKKDTKTIKSSRHISSEIDISEELINFVWNYDLLGKNDLKSLSITEKK